MLSAFPAPQRYRGDSQLYTSAAVGMLTSFKNSIVHAFEARQKRYVRTWLRANNIRDRPFDVIKAINAWGVRVDLSPFVEGLVELERRELGLAGDAAVTTAFLAANVAPVLASYRRWLGYLENREAKGFSVSPIWDVRAHFIKLDIDATHGLL